MPLEELLDPPVSRESAPATDSSITVRDYLEVIRARRGVLLGTFLVVLLLDALATFSQTPIFRATSLLLIEPRKPNVANVNVQEAYDMTMGIGGAEFYKTQFEILRSRRIIDPAAEGLVARFPDQFLTSKMIQVEPVADSRLVRVSVDSPDKRFATEAANTLVDQYVDDTAQRSAGVSDRGLKKLQEMEEVLRPKYAEAARAEQQFKEDNNLSSVDEAQSIASQELRILLEELARIRVNRTKATAELRAAESMASSNVFPLAGEAGTVTAGSSLRLELSRIELERAELLGRVKPEHPQVRALEGGIAAIRSQIDVERSAYVERFRTNRLTAAAQEEDLQAEIAKASSAMRELDRKAIQLQLLRRDAEAIAGSYKSVTQRIAEVTLAISTGSKENNVFVIDRAIEPGEPIRPDKRKNLALGALAGALAGILMCFALERLNNTITRVEDIEHHLRYPLLGIVPRIVAKPNGTENGTPGSPPELAAVSQPKGTLAEAFRTIRTALSFTLPPGSRQILLITSPAPGDGKTFSSVNLAFTLAQTGKRVLIIDADLRRPRLHKVFALESGETGLSTLLAGTGEPTVESARVTGIPNIDVLPGGPVPPNPAELLQSERMRALLDNAVAAYDWVIVDGPPVLAVADASILFAQIKHAIIVVRTLVTEKRAAARTKALLSRSPGTVAGVILNDGNRPQGYGYYNRYGYGYGYGYYYREHEGDGNAGASRN